MAEESLPWQTMAGAGFQDAWLTAARREGPSTTWCGFEDPGHDSRKRIDWILHRGPVVVERAEAVTFNRDGRYPSDHLPVFAVCRLDP